MRKKIVIAAGGTGGHLFPAQALAQELLQQEISVVFVGHGLETNRYFRREEFEYVDVASATPYTKNPFKALLEICKGIKKSLKIARSVKPDLVVGFGSFHSLPILVVALFFRVPILLFEANSIPGKVNRLFSRWAEISAVHFPEAAECLFGKKQEVAMPLWKGARLGQEKARAHFSLDPTKETLLIFGGSQGALAINALAKEAARHYGGEFQVLHFTGEKESIEEVKKWYRDLNICACVKQFENRMDLAWQAATLAVCRSGAGTVAELIEYEVPSILLPYPHAAEDHQRKNAEWMENMGAAYHLKDVESFIPNFVKCKERLSQMQEAIRSFKKTENKQSLSSLVSEVLCQK